MTVPNARRQITTVEFHANVLPPKFKPRSKRTIKLRIERLPYQSTA
jgi:hypothetical protein